MQESEQTSGDVWGKLAAFGESFKLLCQEEELHEKEGQGEKEEGEQEEQEKQEDQEEKEEGKKEQEEEEGGEVKEEKVKQEEEVETGRETQIPTKEPERDTRNAEGKNQHEGKETQGAAEEQRNIEDRTAMQNVVSKAAVNDGRRDTHANAAEDKASA